MAQEAPISFRPTADDKRIIEKLQKQREGITPTEILRRGLQSLERDEWRAQAALDAWRIRDEDLSNEPDDWSYDENGNVVVHIGGKK
jgi:hypothetical protein